MYINKLKQMFEEVTVNKNAQAIPDYYHPELKLYTNNQVMDYKVFFDGHIKTCASPIKFAVSYDEETIVEHDDKVALRMWIDVTLPVKGTHRLELMLSAAYKDDKIYRLWELTYPDWSALPELASY